MRVMTLSLEVQHRVDNVLERFRPGKVAVLRHVADKHDRNVTALGSEQQMRRDLPHLADAPRRGLEFCRRKSSGPNRR